MNIFISWSGERSKKVAECIKEWLKCVIQAVKPWISSEDIDRGALWFSEIGDNLANTNVGIICLTKENKDRPWILFEAGALAKGLTSNRVCTFLIDLKSTDLRSPLSQFNHTEATNESLWKLVSTINRGLKENSLDNSVLRRVFDTYYPQFEKQFKDILTTTPESEVLIQRDESEVLLEVLSNTRELNKKVLDLEGEIQAKRNEHLFLPEEKKRNPYRLIKPLGKMISVSEYKSLKDYMTEYITPNDSVDSKNDNTES